jgi:hypothetical protein
MNLPPRCTSDFRALGVGVEAVEADLATIEGVERLYAATRGRRVEATPLPVRKGFLDQDFHEIRRVIETNITVRFT